MPFGEAGHLSDLIFHAPRSQALALCRTLSVTYPLCGSALTGIWYMPTKTYILLPVFVPSIIHNLTRAAYSPNGFHKLSWPGLKPATPRWECQHSNHADNPTCLCPHSWLASSIVICCSCTASFWSLSSSQLQTHWREEEEVFFKKQSYTRLMSSFIPYLL